MILIESCHGVTYSGTCLFNGNNSWDLKIGGKVEIAVEYHVRTVYKDVLNGG